MPTTPTFAFRYPAPTDPADVPSDINKLGLDVESTLGSFAQKSGVVFTGPVGHNGSFTVNEPTGNAGTINFLSATYLTLSVAHPYGANNFWRAGVIAFGYGAGGVAGSVVNIGSEGNVVGSVVAGGDQSAVNLALQPKGVASVMLRDGSGNIRLQVNGNGSGTQAWQAAIGGTDIKLGVGTMGAGGSRLAIYSDTGVDAGIFAESGAAGCNLTFRWQGYGQTGYAINFQDNAGNLYAQIDNAAISGAFNFSANIAFVGMKRFEVGAPDSGGSGYRMIRCTN